MSPLPGDFAVVRTRGPIGWLIRRATRSPWNHAVVFVSAHEVVEARPRGAVQDRFDYPRFLISTGRVPLTDQQRSAVVAQAKTLVGVGYGFLDLLSLATLQYGLHWRLVRQRVARSDRLICSQLVDLAYSRAGVHLFSDGRLPQDVTPGDLGHLIEGSA